MCSKTTCQHRDDATCSTCQRLQDAIDLIDRKLITQQLKLGRHGAAELRDVRKVLTGGKSRTKRDSRTKTTNLVNPTQ